MSAFSYVFYGFYRSSCSGRLRIVLNLKNIECETVSVNLAEDDQLSDEHKTRNPSASVPLLVCKTDNGTFNIGQSLAAIEYLEEAHPESYSVLPSTSHPQARAAVRTLANVIACDIQPLTNMRAMKRVRKLGGDDKEWNKRFMTEGLEAYETIAKDWAGKYSVGDGITMADACLLPAVWNAQRFGVDLDAFPIITRIVQALGEHPAVIKAHWQNQPDTPEALRAK